MKSLEKCWLVSKYLQIYKRNPYKNIDWFQIFGGNTNVNVYLLSGGWVVGGRCSIFRPHSGLTAAHIPELHSACGLASLGTIFSKKKSRNFGHI